MQNTTLLKHKTLFIWIKEAHRHTWKKINSQDHKSLITSFLKVQMSSRNDFSIYQ